MMSDFVGYPSTFYETGMEGVEWVVDIEGSLDYPKSLENGDYVKIYEMEDDALVFESFLFFNPYVVNLCRLGKIKVSVYPSKGFPEGVSPSSWEFYFINEDIYRIEVTKDLLEKNVLDTLLLSKMSEWKKEYEIEIKLN